jgi:hypothetical protein
MPRSISMPSPEREALVQWVAGLGAVTVEALALRLGVSLASARGRLFAAQRAGLLAVHRPGPVLFTVTPAGLRACCEPGLQASCVSPASARHLAVCARVAAALEHCYPECVVVGERELRLRERGVGALASASVGLTPGGAPALHRPDVVLWPARDDAGLPVAVEVELTVKAPARLLEICRAWARARCVAGVLYLAAPEVRPAVQRAIARARAQEQVVVLGFDTVPGLEGPIH